MNGWASLAVFTRAIVLRSSGFLPNPFSVGGRVNAARNSCFSRGNSIVTFGDRSYGALAQSLGGGGGDGGFSVAGGLTANVNISLALGGSGGTASSAGNVYLENHSSITTIGNDSHALFAQSVGGGGGWLTVTRAVAS